ncbi:hypothetical protein [Hyalangium versicolor]|uniref:hypothetical protein n=1 Tax=Hyalangium versicolor TaxID=2861190 RepID=UPI00272C8BBF|nr:hypothetical protein [Hyalangium versicolor]
MPVSGFQLLLIAILQDIEQFLALGGAQGLQAEDVEDEYLGFGQALECRCVPSARA